MRYVERVDVWVGICPVSCVVRVYFVGVLKGRGRVCTGYMQRSDLRLTHMSGQALLKRDACGILAAKGATRELEVRYRYIYSIYRLVYHPHR